MPAQLINGSTYVPLRFISENLGAKVNYNTKTRAIAIEMKTYLNKAQGFEMVLPTNWIVDQETTEGVQLSAQATLYSQVGLADKGDGIDTSNFNEFAEETFKAYTDKEVLNQFVNGLSAVVLYKEDGLLNIHAYKLLDKGIYFCVFAIQEESIDAGLAAQCDIVINSLKSVTIK